MRLSTFDFIKKLGPVPAVERRKSMHEFVNQRAKTPPVDSFSVSFLLDDFRSKILWGAAN